MTASDTAPSKPEAICWRGSNRQSGSRCHSGNDSLDSPPSSLFFKLSLLPQFGHCPTTVPGLSRGGKLLFDHRHQAVEMERSQSRVAASSG